MKRKEWLKMWLKERDEVVKTYDVEAFKRFYKKWNDRGFYIHDLPSDSVIEVSLRKMAYHTASYSEQEKADAKEWLESRGFTTDT